MINFDKKQKEKIAFATSKGNLPKWKIRNNWYKVDYFGYENLSECIISDLLKYSNAKNFISYKIEKGIYKNKNTNISISKNFLKLNENFITCDRLYLINKETELSKDLLKYNSIKSKIKHTVDTFKNITKIENIGKYLTMILEIDMFFLNEDRHFNNIGFIYNANKNSFSFSPIFDNGLSLLSDINEYDINEDVYKLIKKVKGKPFDNSLETQCEAAEALYKPQIKFDFDNTDLQNELAKYKEYYDTKILDRVEKIILEQRRKYLYLF